MSVFLALFMPWLVGAGLWSIWVRPRGAGALPMTIGGGFLLGAALVAIVLFAVEHAGAETPRFVVLFVLALAAGLVLTAYWGQRPKLTRPNLRAGWTWQRWLWLLVLTLIAARLWLLFSNAIVMPVLPWDAWSVWAFKAKTAFFNAAWPDFVHPNRWIDGSAAASSVPNEAWHYPPFVPLQQLWMAYAHDGWHESALAWSWVSCWIALLCMAYGGLRNLGVTPLPAIVGCYALASLPLINVHVVLFGYADLWLSLAYLSAFVSTLVWLRGEAKIWGVLACVGLLFAIKLEGSVWAFTIILGALVGALSWRGRAVALVVGIVALGIWFAVGGFGFTLQGEVDAIAFRPDLVRIPVIADFPLSWRNVTLPFLTALFAVDNWHLLWTIAVPVMLYLPFRLETNTEVFGARVMLIGGLLFLFILFFFTDAAEWADNFTSTNRVIMHLTPALLVFITWRLWVYGHEFTARAPNTDDAFRREHAQS